MKVFVLLGALLLVAVVAAKREPSPLNPSKLALLPKDCGVTKLGRISNSTVSEAFEYPWIALVLFNKTRRPATCFGSLITRRYVLSVINCIRKTKQDPNFIRLGEQNEATKEDCVESKDEKTGAVTKECAGPVIDIPIESYVAHPEFDQPMYTNDIAVIRMSREVEYNDYIRPICLPTTPALRAQIPKHLVMPVWELDNDAPNHYYGALQKFYVEDVDLDSCQREYEKAGFSPEFGDDDMRMCALQVGPNYVCGRPAGAPIGTEVEVDGTWRHVQYGLAKWSPLNCTFRHTVPMISMDITQYMGWITEHLEA
ncbi:serine protease easter-like [Uranotaenia lowii]|uniref:serine protease easter-like n=1 Tax=Uranotaenia lowii TaxID=190385 RepID=UPI002478F40C|nr:serine protease easter-like [Uranotaenia lowii]